MGFFDQFNAWLTAILANYIGDYTARVSSTLEPTIVTLGVLYVVIWGYLHLVGKIEEPFIAGVKRVMALAVILGTSLSLWLYNSIIVDTFFNAPAQLAASVIGAYDSVAAIDQILFLGNESASALIRQGGVLVLRPKSFSA